MTEYERLRRWLEETFGSRIISQSVLVEDGIAVIEEEIDMSPEAAILLDDVYDALGLRGAPWIIEEDVGTRRVIKFPVVAV